MTLVLKAFATPVMWILVLLVLGLVLTRRTRGKRVFALGRWFLLLATVLLFALSLSPVANLLTYPLEHRYPWPSPTVVGRLDIVVVLGGGVYPSGGLRHEAEISDFAYPRFYHGVRIFRQSGADLLAFCGGPDRESAESEAGVMKAMAISLGVPEERIVVEERSHNTMENAVNLVPLLPAGQGRRIGLVTTATHMWRSHRVLAGRFPRDTIVPVPVYYTYRPASSTIGNFIPSAGNFDRSTVALHEWIGLLWYAVRY